MLPPIHKSTNGLANERSGSGIGGGFFNDSNRKQVIAAGFSSSSRVGYPETQPNGVMSVGTSSSFSPGLERMAERLHALERENEHFREELQHLRHFYSSNQQQHENEKLSVGRVAEDLQRLAHSFNSKLQADMIQQQREQQKAALLFAEVARLGHRVEGLESELRGVVDDTYRKFEAQEQHAQFIASVSSKQQHQAVSPSRNAEFHRQLRDMQDAMVQLRSELDADRSARWKNDAAVDAKLDTQLERLNSKLATDKRDLARVLDEQRQLVTGADFQRVTSHMREFSRVNDHLLALERWLHSEFGQIKRVFQALTGDVDARFQCVLQELANGLKMWHSAQVRQEDELELKFQDLEESVHALVAVVQRKLHTLEEVIPLEVQARQKNDDKLRRRVEGVVKALGHAIETSRGEYLPQQSTLAHRVHQLELAQHNTSGEASMQHNAMRETIQAFMEDSDAMLVRLAAAVEQERAKGIELVTARDAIPLELPTHLSEELRAESKRVKDELSALQVWTTMHAQECQQFLLAVPMVAPATASVDTSEEVKAEAKRVNEEVDALQAWTVMHAQECRQFFDFLNWSMDDVRRESAVVQCLDAVIDQIVETRACGHLDSLAKGVTGALRQIAVAQTASTLTSAASLITAESNVEAERDRASYSLRLSGQGYPQSAENSSRSLRSEEGATDMLDLSTTTYYASTDGEVALNGVQADQLTENDEYGEEQEQIRDETTGGIPSEGSAQPPAGNNQGAADLLGSPSLSYETYSESTGNAQVNLMNSVENDATSDPEEDEYSMDMTQDEEVKADQPAVAHSELRDVTTESQDNLHEALTTEQIDHPKLAAETLPQVNETPDEEEPLTLDL